MNVTASNHLGKRRKGTAQKVSESPQQFSSSWVSDVSENQCPGGYWFGVQPRLFPALSDPAVCGYSVPFRYPMEPVSLPVIPMYTPQHVTHLYQAGYPHSRVRQRHKQRGPPPVVLQYENCSSQHSKASQIHKTTSTMVNNSNGDFASLPPLQLGMPESTQRRFSDPVIKCKASAGSGSEDSDDSQSSCSSPFTTSLVHSLMEQVGALQESNRRLAQELHSTRIELETVKLQAVSWRKSDFEPGVIAELVREIRDAALKREEALLTKVRSMLGSTNGFQWNEQSPKDLSVPSERDSQETKDLDELRTQVEKSQKEKAIIDERLLRLEEELKQLRINSQVSTSSRKKNVNSVDPVRENLKNSLWAKHEVESSSSSMQESSLGKLKYDQLKETSSKKINGTSQEIKQLPLLQQRPNDSASSDQYQSSLENTSESLASLSSNHSSIHSPTVTMSGPVTEL